MALATAGVSSLMLGKLCALAASVVILGPPTATSRNVAP